MLRAIPGVILGDSVVRPGEEYIRFEKSLVVQLHEAGEDGAGRVDLARLQIQRYGLGHFAKGICFLGEAMAVLGFVGERFFEEVVSPSFSSVAVEIEVLGTVVTLSGIRRGRGVLGLNARMADLDVVRFSPLRQADPGPLRVRLGDDAVKEFQQRASAILPDFISASPQ